jgi:hypothetical protein
MAKLIVSNIVSLNGFVAGSENVLLQYACAGTP